ncbi:hypothetical protein EJ07DRAFT_160218 [Lizonia empirigonia]|nr:hypothetical protein EJ07DRAFT_160218 [Lizonia empirigonia]
MAPIAMKNVVPTKKSTPSLCFTVASPPTKRKAGDEPVENEPAKRQKIVLDRETPLPVASLPPTKRKAGDMPSQKEPAKRQKIRDTPRLLAKTPTSVKASTAAQGSPPALPSTAAATPALSTQASLASSILSSTYSISYAPTTHSLR